MTPFDPAPEDDRLAEMLGSADEALDAFDPIMEKGAWEALTARLDLLGPILSPEKGPYRDPAGDDRDPSRPARIGRYELLGELGTGGFGIVFRAFDPQMRRTVALKVPRPELLLMSEGRQRFLREAQAAGSLDHPGIVPVYDAGEIGQACFIASACCEGPDLGVWLKDRTEAVPYPLAAHLVARLADAVSYTHERGILHRDIKPSNVLLFPEADEGQGEHAPTLGFAPRLGDFGLARLAEEQSVTLTRSGLPLGSPPYMSPEQAAGHIHLIGPATDIYALGALLYEVVTGRPPFRGATNLETLRLVTDTDPVPPRMLRSGLPRDLETIILTCLQKVPARRYSSAAALRDDLRRYLAGRPILARPTPPWEHILKAARRHPAVAAIVATAAMLAIGGGATVIWSNARLRSYAAELERQRDRADGLHYASQLQLARRTQDEGQLGRAQQLLREIRLGPHAPDRREFAWRYLWSSTRREAVLIGETDSLIQGGTLSRDGRLLVLSDHAGGLSAFDLPKDRVLWADPHAGEQTIDNLNFDPRSHLLAVAYGEKNADGSHKLARVELHEAATGRPLVALPPLPGRVVLDVKLPGDDGLLAVHHAPPGGRNGATVAVWSLGGDPDHPRPRLLRQREGLDEVTFAPDGKAFFAQEPAGRVGVFETVTLEERAALSDAPTDLTLPAHFAPDGLRVAAGHAPSRSLLIWDATNGRQIHKLEGFGARVHRIVMAPRGPCLLAVDDTHSVHLVNLETGRRITVFPASPDTADVNTHRLCFSPDGSSFLVQRSNYLRPDVIELRDASDGRVLATCRVRQMGWCSFWDVLGPEQGGPALVFALGRSAWRWRYDSASPSRAAPVLSHSDEAWALAFSPDGRILATGSNDTTERETIRLWDVGTGRLIRGWKAHHATVTGLDFSPDGRVLASSSLDSDADVQLWDPETGRLLTTLAWPTRGARGIAFSPDGQRLAASGSNGSVQVWDAQRLQPVASLAAHSDQAHGVGFSPDERFLATVGDDCYVRLWDVTSSRLLAERREPEQVYALAFSKDGKALAVAGRSGMIALLDPANLTPRQTIRSDDKEIRALAFSPDGRTLAAAGMGLTIRLWDPTTGQELLVLDNPTAQVNALSFSPDGKTLAACDHTGRVWLYRAESL